MVPVDDTAGSDEGRHRMQEVLAELVRFYEQLTPETVAQVGMLYAPGARFKDPFNEVEGVAAIEHIFRHMFRQVERPRFVVDSSLLDGAQAMLCWRFLFSSGGRNIEVRGASHVAFDADGRVRLHRDYWDTGEELYAKFPLIGPLVRWLTRRLSATRETG